MLTRAQQIRPEVSRTITFPAPSKGWVQAGNIVTASPDQAEVLDNFFCTAQGARLRGGATEFADIGAAIVRLFVYESGAVADMFASTATGIYDADRVNGTGAQATFADVEGLGSGDWSAFHQSSAAGQFLMAVNGTDYLHYYDGTDWNPVTDEAIFDLSFDAETGAFTVGETVTGGTSGASAEILSITKTSATAGTLRLGAITSGPFSDNETITDGATGSATADGASAAGSTVTFTGIATTALSQGWIFKERAFFIEGGSTSAWYLNTSSIGGAATELDLGAVLNKGGALLFGATWSLDSGSGLDDVCIFVSTEGEIVVYEGTNPNSASTWALVGVYEVAKPLNKHGFFKAGGDLAILTEDGIIPLSEAVKRDRAALQTIAITYPIEDAWKDVIANREAAYSITATLWQSQALLIVGTPATYGGKRVSFAANARRSAWSRILGWDVRCSTVHNDLLYFGTNAGKVFRGDSGGTDDGVAYTGYCVPKFQDADILQSANSASVTYRCNAEIDLNLYAHADYQVDDMGTPATATFDAGDVWGTGVWGTFVWGSDTDLGTYTNQQFVRASGYSMAPGLALTSNQTAKLDFDILVMRLRVEGGYPL